ncbi:glycoside hydrolase family protein [Catenuloplanes indicus]|uniref:Ricin B lectin domain-containing protein n=1 Tax=Catenuloplanes indicus TaxID=137267 RepID=A0AAE3VW60_9ACTN|nr:glycoside hydrolase family protein [Catenuloplanes indicus]MDQ0364839.1 hypothetical protein [Catenuloplanes indicus]
MSASKVRRRVLGAGVSATVVAALGGGIWVTDVLAADGTAITGLGGRCVDVAGANRADGTAVQLWDCNGTGAQQWRFEGASLRALGKCLDVTSASRADGARVQLHTCNGTGAQTWAVRGSQLVNTGSGKCLDETGMSTASGTRLQIWSCTGNPNQSWRVSTPAPAPSPTGGDSGGDGAKKGVSSWEFAGLAGAVDDAGVSWYYNWGTNNDAMPAGAEFVPMIWDENVVTPANLAKVRAEGDTLLGFNEPDLAEQANMSVEQALGLWPRLEATGMRLGSPAVAWGGDAPGGWLDRFMTGARQRGLRVDFITLHWYGGDFSAAATGQFMGYVRAVHERYGLPIWVTEYGLMNFSAEPRFPSTAQITAFITASTRELEAAPYVERYAWFSLPAVGDSLPYGLYRDATTPTEAGRAYRAAG